MRRLNSICGGVLLTICVLALILIVPIACAKKQAIHQDIRRAIAAQESRQADVERSNR